MTYEQAFSILGILPNANEAQIKTAYRRLAKKYHPDANPGDKDAEAKFKEAGEAFAWVLRLYETSQERENSLFDLGEECIWEKDIPKLLKGLDDAEIKEFTFSSTWSGSNQTAWEFIKGGWSIKGMTLINTHKKWREEGYQQKPAYIFSKN